ncbi:MAG TPA: carbonic anhydrase [Ginsengibacter sp.]|nr:carbonic anhydrase [Chitinophagaceae bacterium]HRN73898.1 carbonic anhydrase [Ginsengibacter sp.]HRP18064.1 carbonic anhydrase [Ginsengibacter sp.]HRP44532.1 carbonic anhydrase [Ginsengibacter sp.]
MSYKSIEEIFRHNEKWVKAQLKADPDYFVKLSKRQKPRYLFISCSDSRISTEVIMDAEPGDVFIHRNVANLVPSNDLNTLSAINYAVKHIKVKHIIICGHYNCGGIKTAMTTSDEGILNPWLRDVRDVYRIHKQELNSIKSLSKKYDRLVELNVWEQCINTMKTRDVQKALAEKRIQIHGWVFNMKTGRLTDLNFKAERLAREIMDIYNLFE